MKTSLLHMSQELHRPYITLNILADLEITRGCHGSLSTPLFCFTKGSDGFYAALCFAQTMVCDYLSQVPSDLWCDPESFMYVREGLVVARNEVYSGASTLLSQQMCDTLEVLHPFLFGYRLMHDLAFWDEAGLLPSIATVWAFRAPEY